MTTHPALSILATPDLRRPILVLAWAGWNDTGESASHAARYLAATSDTTAVASIDPEDFYDFTEARPLARYRDGEREIVWPSTEFFALRLPGQPHDILLGVGVEPNHRWKSYMAALAELIDTFHVSLVITLGAVAAAVPHSRPAPVRGSANLPALQERYQMRPSRFEGSTGIVGVFHDFCRRRDVGGLSLWAPVSHYIPGLTNPLGSRALLERLAEITGLAPDYSFLDGEITRFQDQMRRATEQNENLAAYVKHLESAAHDKDTGNDAPPEGARELPAAESIIADLEEFLRSHREGDD